MSSGEQVINLSQSFWQLKTANAFLNSPIMGDIQQMPGMVTNLETEAMREMRQRQNMLQTPADTIEPQVIRDIRKDTIDLLEHNPFADVMRNDMAQNWGIVTGVDTHSGLTLAEKNSGMITRQDVIQTLGVVPIMEGDLSSFTFGEQFPWILKEFPTLSNEAKSFLGTTISIKPRNPVCFDEKNLDKKNVESYDTQIEHPDTKVQQTPSFNDLINNKVEFQKDTDIDTSTVKNQLEEFICVTNKASELIPNEIRKPVKEIQGNINRALLKPKVLTVLFFRNLTLSILLTLSFSGAALIENLVNFETNVTLNKTEVTQIENNNTNDIIVIHSNPQITINGDVENPQYVIDQCLERQAELFAEIIEAALQNE